MNVDHTTGEILDQPALLPMSPDEVQRAGRTLARLLRELDVLDADAAEARKEYKREREKLVLRIASTAEAIRTQGRDPMVDELRALAGRMRQAAADGEPTVS